MQTTLENKKKVVTNFPISALKKNNKIEEGGASCSNVKKEQDIIDVRAQKMMKGKVEPFVVPIVVRATR